MSLSPWVGESGRVSLRIKVPNTWLVHYFVVVVKISKGRQRKEERHAVLPCRPKVEVGKS